jgi:secondary thiamine-phosphate synthase enzyme
MVQQREITLQGYQRGYHLITPVIVNSFNELPEKGIMHIMVKHTSAGITLNENADPSVRYDFKSFFDTLVPENFTGFTHNTEGPDDMPAHIKASVIGQSVTIPISDHSLNLGIWQGIYFCEFRNGVSARKIVLTVIS